MGVFDVGGRYAIVQIEKDKRHGYALKLEDLTGGCQGEPQEALEPLMVQRDMIVRFGLYKGLVLTGETLNDLVEASQYHLVYEKALSLLGGSDHFSQKMRQKLRQRDFDASLIDRVIDQLTQEGLLNDTQTALQWVSHQEHKKSISVMRMNLKEMGLSGEIIEMALATVGVEPCDMIRGLIDKKARGLGIEGPGRPIEPRAREKLLGYLIRQGFDYSSCKRALASFESDDN